MTGGGKASEAGMIYYLSTYRHNTSSKHLLLEITIRMNSKRI